ncbi:hypothetical protein [Actinopolyspora erythraea]|uniref:hypothetical protein n=1 Tax=Actinopolyspora erythraea TaxID=414996 RepID=UPI000AA64D1B|nr:hypothetical protein [Actinopolyspora erythraea]
MRFFRDRRRWLSWWDGKLRSLVFDLLVVALLIRQVSTGDEPSGLLVMLRRTRRWCAAASG